jgi:hypothetical protein
VMHALGVDDDVSAVRLEDEYRVFDDEVLVAVLLMARRSDAASTTRRQSAP